MAADSVWQSVVGSEYTHPRDLLEDRVAELREKRGTQNGPVVLAEVERAVLVRRSIGDVESGLRGDA